jgi:hypothetical protein
MKILLAALLSIGPLIAQQETLTAPRAKCCNPCKPPSSNCPPQRPLCNPCDCIFDFYNPLIYNGFTITAEWLYWKVQQKASTFVLNPHGMHQSFPPSTLSDALGKYQSAKFNWSSGVRIALDYTFKRDAWNFLGQYTYYGTDGSANVFRPSNPTLYIEPTVRGVILPSPSDGADQMVSKTLFSYQGIDLLLSRRYLASCQILLNFFSGATAAFIHEKWKVSSYYTVGADPNISIETQNNWSFDGGGIRTGINADWHMGWGFGLFQRFSLAGLIGHYSNKRKTRFDPPNIIQEGRNTFNPVRNTVQYETWVVPNTQLAFGLTWNRRLSSYTSMRVMAGFEANTWYDLHQFHQDGESLQLPNREHLDIENSSAVNLWGLNLGIDFSF